MDAGPRMPLGRHSPTQSPVEMSTERRCTDTLRSSSPRMEPGSRSPGSSRPSSSPRWKPAPSPGRPTSAAMHAPHASLVVMDGLLKLSAPPVVIAPPSSRARARPTSAVQLIGGKAFPPLRPGSAAVQVGGQYLPPPHPLEPYLPGSQMHRLQASHSAPRMMPLRKKKGGGKNPHENLERSLERMGDALVRETAYEQERLQAEKQRLEEAESALRASFEAQINALKKE